MKPARTSGQRVMALLKGSTSNYFLIRGLSMKPARTSAQRVKSHDDTQRALGRKGRKLWATPAEHVACNAFLETLRSRRDKPERMWWRLDETSPPKGMATVMVSYTTTRTGSHCTPHITRAYVPSDVGSVGVAWVSVDTEKPIPGDVTHWAEYTEE